MAAKLCLQQRENNTELLFGEADSLKYAVMFCLSPSLAWQTSEQTEMGCSPAFYSLAVDLIARNGG